MDDAFLAALFPGRHRVLGYVLRPYCHGHLATLYACHSPFVDENGGVRVGAGDLVLGLRVCQSPGFPLLTPHDLRPRWRDALRIWWLERKPERLAAAVAAFEAYQDAHGSFPAFYSNDPTVEDDDVPEDVPADRPLSAPFLLARIAGLISRTSLTQAEAWQMPLALPAWLTGALNELEGAPVRFLDESEDVEEALPPDVTKLSEREMYKLAVAQMGKEAADAWREARRVTRKKERRKKKGKNK